MYNDPRRPQEATALPSVPQGASLSASGSPNVVPNQLHQHTREHDRKASSQAPPKPTELERWGGVGWGRAQPPPLPRCLFSPPCLYTPPCLYSPPGHADTRSSSRPSCFANRFPGCWPIWVDLDNPEDVCQLLSTGWSLDSPGRDWSHGVRAL